MISRTLCNNIENILIKYGICINNTPYAGSGKFFQAYPLYYLGNTDAIKINSSKYLHEFPAVEVIMEEVETLKKEYNLTRKYSEMKECKTRIKKFKMDHGKINLGFDDKLKEQYLELIKIKKDLMVNIVDDEKIIFEEIYKKYKIDMLEDLVCIKIRDIALCNTAENIINIIPKLEDTYLQRSEVPIFSHNLKDFANKQKNENSAIEGGPCIIGVDEAFFRLVYKNGQRRYFDIMTGFEDGYRNTYLPKKYDLADIIETDRNDIVEVEICEKNSGPTLFNAIEIYRLMLIAKKLDLPLVIGLPDESYRKFLSCVIDPLEMADGVYNDLNNFFDKIVNEFLKLIDSINKNMKLDKIEIFHSRNAKLIETFYQNRQAVSLSIGDITDIQVKKEAIIDYLCMPATPNFIWDATNILEVNNIMELESLKGSIKLFSDINFGALIFPYVPDINDYSSMYHGKCKDKIYLDGNYDIETLSTDKLDSSIIAQVPWQ